MTHCRWRIHRFHRILQIQTRYGTPIVSLNRKVQYRAKKDLVPLETGTGNPVIMYEHFYGLYNSLTDAELVYNLNGHIGLNYWGMGRAAVIRAIRSQLRKRGIDTSSINSKISFSLAWCVVLINKKLHRLDELPESRITPIVNRYLRECYPDLETEEIEIIDYDLEKMQIYSSILNKYYEIPVNDLIRKKREMRSISGTPK